MATLFYSEETGSLFTGDSVEWLKGLNPETVDFVFADPPYNVKKASWDCFKSQEDYIEWTLSWTREVSRILKSSGSFMICGYTEVLADMKRLILQDFQTCKWLIWFYKNKANLSNDWGRSHESILLFRKSKKNFVMNIDDVRVPYGAHTLKYPHHPQAETSQYGGGEGKKRQTWTPNPLGAKPRDVIEIPTTCNGMHEKTPHPTQKPEELVRKLVLASTNAGDVVLDPFSGSGTTAVVAKQLGRKWIACDESEQYNEWAVNRLQSVVKKSVEEWKDYDRQNDERRRSIR